jgi:hypothetical protein
MAASAAAASIAGDDVEASFRFDEASWLPDTFARTVLPARRSLFQSLRPHDGLPGASIRTELLSRAHGGEKYDQTLMARLSWAAQEHSLGRRTNLLKALFCLLPDSTQGSLFGPLLRWAPQLTLVQAIVALLPQSGLLLSDRGILLSLLSDLVTAPRPPLDTLNWLLKLVRKAEARWTRFSSNPLAHLVSVCRALTHAHTAPRLSQN